MTSQDEDHALDAREWDELGLHALFIGRTRPRVAKKERWRRVFLGRQRT